RRVPAAGLGTALTRFKTTQAREAGAQLVRLDGFTGEPNSLFVLGASRRPAVAGRAVVSKLIQGHGQHANGALCASCVDRALQQLGAQLALAQKQPRS